MYTVKDLEEWSENHDSFRHEQNLVQWTETKRPCVEAFFHRGCESIECFNAQIIMCQFSF
jgi:hypothetical protein